MHIHRLFLQINQSNCKYLIARNYARKLGSVALVTGASTGIGKSMCNSLLKAGVKVSFLLFFDILCKNYYCYKF